MPGAVKKTINGIEYPREVPVLEGMPEGWKGIEQAYGPTSKYFGKTYVRYSSLDGKHKSVMGPKQVVQIHCETHGLDFDSEFAKYTNAMQAKKDSDAQEREAKGKLKGEKREQMIELCRETVGGELTGPLVMALPGWKCRWEFLPESQQMPKTFIDPEGREFKLLKEIEAAWGLKIEKGEGVEKIFSDLEAARSNTEAQEYFYQGSRLCRESQGAIELDPATMQETVLAASKEEQAARKEERQAALEAKRQAKKGIGNLLLDWKPSVYPVQSGWAALSSPDDLKAGFAKFHSRLRERGFPDNVELLAVRNVGNASPYAGRISGIYYQIQGAVNERRCYQKLLDAPGSSLGFCCDGVYIMWNSAQPQWQIVRRPENFAPCIAYCKDGNEFLAAVSGTWQVQKGKGDFEEDASLKIITAIA